MSPYMGGSAPAMASQVSDGYTLVSAVQLKRLTDPELDLLQAELERMLRDLRSVIVPLDDVPAIQARQRRMTRITGALQQIQMAKSKRRRSA
ncbi:MAG: hypothetical protein PHQ91_05490 [Thermoanaerobaculaceae bacterium]|nr:hypothetical protein [Thermoanaerobaculaceae bacterium]TAM52303.1 MAG: hypothetical protein EPN53_06100 [Acidobacteriota bacterium]